MAARERRLAQEAAAARLDENGRCDWWPGGGVDEQGEERRRSKRRDSTRHENAQHKRRGQKGQRSKTRPLAWRTSCEAAAGWQRPEAWGGATRPRTSAVSSARNRGSRVRSGHGARNGTVCLGARAAIRASLSSPARRGMAASRRCTSIATLRSSARRSTIAVLVDACPRDITASIIQLRVRAGLGRQPHLWRRPCRWRQQAWWHR